jgi:hypothetical protein
VDAAVIGDERHQLLAVEAALDRDLLEDRVHLDEAVVVHDGADVGDREERLDARGAVGDDRERAGWRDRGDGGVADRAAIGRVVDRPSKFGKAPRSSASLREAALPSASM